MVNEVATRNNAALTLEQVVIGGDLANLNPEQRVTYYNRTCESMGLNPLTRPFEYITLNGKLRLYARRDCTDQLRKIHGVSIEKVEHQEVSGVYVVTAYAKDKAGKIDSDIGAVPIEGLKGEFRANAVMKAMTKAKRRVTLSICGLGMLDESEVDSVQDEPFHDPSRKVRPAQEANARNEPESSPERDKLIDQLEDAAAEGSKSLEAMWKAFQPRERKLIGKDEIERIKKVAEVIYGQAMQEAGE